MYDDKRTKLRVKPTINALFWPRIRIEIDFFYNGEPAAKENIIFMHYFIVLQIAKLNGHNNTQYPERYKTTKRIQAITPKRTKEHHKTF